MVKYGGSMSKEVINVHGEERVVREDTAKAYRGMNWALLSILAFILIAGLLLFSSVLTGVFYDGKPANTAPAPSSNVGP
jgi:hypothetical protein